MSDELRAAAERIIKKYNSPRPDNKPATFESLLELVQWTKATLKAALAAPPDGEAADWKAKYEQLAAGLIIAYGDERIPLRKEVATLTADRDDWKAKVESLEAEYDQLRGENDRLRVIADDYRKGAEVEAGLHDEARKELARLRSELEKVNALAREFGYGQGELDEDLAGCLRMSINEHWQRLRPVSSPPSESQSTAITDNPEADGTDAAHPAWWRGHTITARRKLYTGPETSNKEPLSEPEQFIRYKGKLLPCGVLDWMLGLREEEVQIC